MTYLFLFVMVVSPGLFASDTYQCTLKARTELNDPFAVSSAAFDGNNAVNLKAKDFTLKVKSTGVGESAKLALWLGTSKSESAVTLADPGTKHLYINMLQNSLFAVGECNKNE